MPIGCLFCPRVCSTIRELNTHLDKYIPEIAELRAQAAKTDKHHHVEMIRALRFSERGISELNLTRQQWLRPQSQEQRNVLQAFSVLVRVHLPQNVSFSRHRETLPSIDTSQGGDKHRERAFTNIGCGFWDYNITATVESYIGVAIRDRCDHLRRAVGLTAECVKILVEIEPDPGMPETLVFHTGSQAIPPGSAFTTNVAKCIRPDGQILSCNVEVNTWSTTEAEKRGQETSKRRASPRPQSNTFVMLETSSLYEDIFTSSNHHAPAPPPIALRRKISPARVSELNGKSRICCISTSINSWFKSKPEIRSTDRRIRLMLTPSPPPLRTRYRQYKPDNQQPYTPHSVRPFRSIRPVSDRQTSPLLPPAPTRELNAHMG